MARITLGRTGITAEQNAFGALPIQRVSFDTAGKLLNRALDGGMDFIDTARAYSDSEEKIGRAISGRRGEYTLATKTMSKTPEGFWRDLHTSLKNLNTDHIDIYQFHCVDQCWRPGDGSGMYECMQEAKAQGKILHISATAHKIGVAQELVESGLYDTLQFPFSYLSGEKEIALVRLCKEKNIGFIAMKALSGGLITSGAAAYAFIAQFDCMPCPAGIEINTCARMIQMIRRSPSARWLDADAQTMMGKIAGCLHCGKCMRHCPYGLRIPELLQKNYEDYQKIVAGEIRV